MSRARERVVAAARAAVGARFRPHGRDPATGLDCVGLVAHALAAGGWRGAAPTGYALRGGDVGAVAASLDAAGLAAVDKASRAGDILLCEAGPAQLHLLVATGTGYVHAHAGLRRVVEEPGAPRWPAIGAWRFEGQGEDRWERSS